MKRYLIITLLLIAATYTDTTNADFSLGTTNNTNITNNSVQLALIGGNYTLSGEYISRVFDLGSNPDANISWSAYTPSGTSLLITTRQGNTSIPDNTWTAYSSVYLSSGSKITGPVSRYYQYRIQLSTINATTTPTLYEVNISYEQKGPQLIEGTRANLTEQTTGNYIFSVIVNDTVSTNLIQARYKIGTGNYTAYTNMTLVSGEYTITIPEPINGWNASKKQNLTVNVYYQNTNSDDLNQTFNELIDHINKPPVINPISNKTAKEDQNINFTVTGTDPDNDTITWSATRGTITKISNTQATFSWTPTSAETGLINITITMSDGIASDEETFTVNVTEVNDPPEISALTPITGYYGERIIYEFTITDPDIGQNHSYTVNPPLFEIEEYYLANTTNSTTYYARINFTALDDHKGYHLLLITVSDGEYTDKANLSINISYCGDKICQANENVTACSKDCSENEQVNYLSIILPERICSNETTVIQTYNSSSRYVCYETRKTDKFQGLCNPVSSSLTIYYIESVQRQNSQTLSTTGQNATVEWTPAKSGEYKIIAQKEGFISAARFVTVGDCIYVNNTKKIITYPKKEIKPEEIITSPQPDIEEPTGVPQKTSIIAIIIWYVIVPLLIVGLVFFSSQYYYLYKDTDVRILKIRVWLAEKKTRIKPKLENIIKPVIKKIKQLRK